MTTNPTTSALANRGISSVEIALEQLRPEIKEIAYWTRAPALTSQERESAAMIGALRAIETYNPAKGASLSTWAQLKARYAIEDEERREQRQRRRFGRSVGVSLNAPEPENEPTDEWESERRERVCELVRYALDLLDKRTREIIERVWYCGESQDEIARSFGFSQSWCSRLYRRGMSRIKEILAPYFTKSDELSDSQDATDIARFFH